MILSAPSSALKGYHFPRSIIGYAVWAYHRFVLNLRDVEDLLAERGVTVSHETIRDWVAKFGTQIAAKIRRDRRQPADKWHLDEALLAGYCAAMSREGCDHDRWKEALALARG